MKRLLVVSLGLVSCVSYKAPKHDPVVTGEAMVVKVAGDGDVIAIGDFGTGTPDQYAVGKAIATYCASISCDLGITLGDNFYPMGVSSVKDLKFQTNFEIPYKDVKFTFYPALGNHDYMGDYLAELEYKSDRWHMPYRYYKIETKYVDYFALDSEHFTSAEYSWLAAGLKDSTATWKVIYLHRPLYSSGDHGDTKALSQYINPLLAKPGLGADFVIAGHDHDLELIERDGRVHIVSGAAGKLRGVSMGEHSIYAASVLGFVHIDFNGDDAIVSFIGKDGQVLFTKTYPKTTNLNGLRLKQESVHD